MAEGGFQPRTTPAERRAFFDIDRRLREFVTQADIDAAVAPLATVAYVDSQFSVVTTVAPSTGWQHYGGSYGQVRVVRAGKMVNLAGLIQATVAATTGTMATVPTGFRPIQQILAGQLTSPGTLARVDITTAGAVVLNAIPAVSIPINGWVALNASWPIA